MTQTYDIVQTTFLLSMAANGASSISATQSQLQGFLEAYLNGGTAPDGSHFDGFFPMMNPQLAGGDWSVVWGPGLYSRNGNQPGEATNAMYVAYSASLSTYVVAIAATNPKSIYDWIAEDINVLPNYMAQWPLAVPFVQSSHWPWILNIPPAISAATALGVSNLLSLLTDPTQGTSLQAFLQAKVNSADTLIFCGHSLAGALSPTLALYLCPNPAQSGWKQVLVLPTAGATPGNTKFAGAFDAAYPAVASGVSAAYGNWNTDYANAHDVVPHAWNQLSGVVSSPDAAGNYPSMYGVMSPAIGKPLHETISAAEAAVALGFYRNVTQSIFQPDWVSWDASTSSWVPLPTYTDANPLSTAAELEAMLLATHIDQYVKFFGVTPPPQLPTAS